MEPIIVDIPALPELRALGEQQLVLRARRRVPAPLRRADHAHAAVGRKPAIEYRIREAGRRRFHHVRRDEFGVRVVAFGVHAVAPRPLLEFRAGGIGAGEGLLVEPAAADEALYDDAALTAVAVFEADDDHAVPLETPAPAVVAVFSADAS